MTDHLSAAVTGGVIEYRTWGTGSPVVFIHGVFVDSRLWDDVAALVGAGHQVFLPDLPLGAHRRAFATDADLSPTGLARVIVEFLDAIDVRDATVVANDTGGGLLLIALASGVDGPGYDAGSGSGLDRIARVVLTNCDSFEHFPPRAFKNMITAVRIGGRRLVKLICKMFTTKRGRKMFFGGVTHREIDAAWADAFFAPALHDAGVLHDLTKVLSGLRPEPSIDAGTRLGRVTIPVLMAWGDQDDLFPMSHGERLTSTFPIASMEVMSGAKTFVALDAPDRLAQAIARFASA